MPMTRYCLYSGKALPIEQQNLAKLLAIKTKVISNYSRNLGSLYFLLILYFNFPLYVGEALLPSHEIIASPL